MKGLLVLSGSGKQASHEYFDFVNQTGLTTLRKNYEYHSLNKDLEEYSYQELINEMDEMIKELQKKGVTEIIILAVSLGSILSIMNLPARKHVSKYFFLGCALNTSKNDVMQDLEKSFKEYESFKDNGFTNEYLKEFNKNITIFQGENDERWPARNVKKIAQQLSAKFYELKKEEHTIKKAENIKLLIKKIRE